MMATETMTAPQTFDADVERIDRPATVNFLNANWDATRARQARAEAIILAQIPARTRGEDDPADDCCYDSGCRRCRGTGTRRR